MFEKKKNQKNKVSMVRTHLKKTHQSSISYCTSLNTKWKKRQTKHITEKMFPKTDQDEKNLPKSYQRSAYYSQPMIPEENIRSYYYRVRGLSDSADKKLSSSHGVKLQIVLISEVGFVLVVIKNGGQQPSSESSNEVLI